MSPSEQNLFELDRNGSLLDMNSFLRSRMPRLFAHFAKEHPWIATVNSSNWQDGDRVWPYILLARATNRSLVPAILNGHIDPTMSDFRDNSGRAACPDVERVVCLGEISSSACPVYAVTDLPHQQPQLHRSAQTRYRNGWSHQILVCQLSSPHVSRC